MKDFQSERDFRFQKAVDIQDKKNMTQMVQVEFLKFQNQVNKRENPHLNLPCEKNKKVCSNYLVCKQTRSQRVILLVLWERKALDDKQNSLSTGAS